MAEKPKRRWLDRQHLEDLAIHIPIAVTVFMVVYLAASAPLGIWPATVGFGLIGALGPVVKLPWQASNSLIFVIVAGAGVGIACRSKAVPSPKHPGSCSRRNDGAI